jgi:hypothetical protein
MEVRIQFGHGEMAVEVEADQRFAHYRGPAAVADVGEAVHDALDSPFSFPPLARCLAPGDRIVALIGEEFPALPMVLEALLERIPEASLVSAAPGPHRWAGSHQVEEHDPKQVAYLASTAAGRRVYINRGIVDADQVVVVSARRYGEGGSIGGAEQAIYPALGDESARGASEAESREAAWLLGLPFHLQVIEAAGGGVARVIAGAADAAREAERVLAGLWRVALPRRVDTVIVALSGEPRFTEMARAAAMAAEVTQPGGRIILLAEGSAPLGPELDILRQAGSPDVPGLEGAARSWARAASHARLSVMSGHDPALLEELFAAPLTSPEQVRRLVARSGDCAVIEDASRFLAVVE